MPEVLSVAQLAIVRSATSSGSSGANSPLSLNITQHANRQLYAGDFDIAGAIMFHGTNTLEEAAFGVDITFNYSKRFIATGSMSPNTYISPDSPSNFYQTVAVAASPSSRDRGGIITFNDMEFDGSVYVVANRAKGLVIMGAGAARLRPSTQAVAADLLSKGIPVVAVARPASGTGVPRQFPGSVQVIISSTYPSPYLQSTLRKMRLFIQVKEGNFLTPRSFFSSYLGAEQARIVIQLGINAGDDMDQIRDLFEEFFEEGSL
ncbi:L-asparaginase, variant [Rhexocercosporidium sp. MPI-PUGE-AT-0058]|nr:L-asparaginase, variant [Rhexocercosporidium sp. MPI-PUGE-AT-0058]